MSDFWALVRILVLLLALFLLGFFVLLVLLLLVAGWLETEFPSYPGLGLCLILSKVDIAATVDHLIQYQLKINRFDFPSKVGLCRIAGDLEHDHWATIGESASAHGPIPNPKHQLRGKIVMFRQYD